MISRFFISLCLALSLCSARQLHALSIDLVIGDYKSGSDTYVEIYGLVLGKSVSADLSGNKSLDVSMLVKRVDQSVHAERFLLQSPHGTESTLDFGFKRRYALQPGQYELFIDAVDNADTAQHVSTSIPFEIKDMTDGPHLGSLLMCKKIKKAGPDCPDPKGGFDMEPLGWRFSRASMKNIFYYSELYNTVAEDVLIMKTAICKTGTIQCTEIQEKKIAGGAFKPVIGKVSIASLESGNYDLRVQIYKDLELLTERRTNFQHSNSAPPSINNSAFSNELAFIDLLTLEELDFALKAVIPRAASTDLPWINTVLREEKKSDLVSALKFQWSKIAPENTEQEYNAYMAVARAVDQEYNSGYGYGFETDRGFYFLKYGKPDNVFRNEQEFDAPPYEMWSYNKIDQTGQADVRFIFYNPTLSPNNYELLHSTARGEPNNPRWEVILYQDVPEGRQGPNHFDATRMQDGINRNARRRLDDF